MKTLINYILNNDKLYQFEEDLITHFEIEHIYNYDILYESNGIFNGCEELVKFIIDYLSEKLTKNENKTLFKKKELIFEITDFINETLKYNNSLVESLSNPIFENNELYTFFDKLTLKIYLCTKDDIEPSYTPHNNYNKDTDKLTNCEIIFNLPKNIKFNFYSNQVKKNLTHELTHAYEDYNRQRKEGVESLKDILDKKIYKIGINKYKSQNAIDKFIGQYTYCSHKQEQNAYLAEYNTLLEEKWSEIDINGNIIKQLFNIIKTSTSYKAYYEVGSVIEMLSTGKLNSILSKIQSSYNDTFNTNLNEQQVVKELSNNWYKIKKKFENQIPKIVYKFILSKNEK